MDSVLKNEQEQLQNLPMIIAMKGLISSGSQKREIASKLAKFLPYPLIDEEDILSNLENFLESSSTNFTTSINELSFKILSQITSKQLQLKLPVILITSFSQSNHLDHLLQLATSNDASLVIIECETEISHQAHGIEHVPKVSMDTTKPFEVEKFVPMILNAAKLYKDRDNLQVLEGKQSEEPCKDAKDIFPERLMTQAHAHEFFFIEKPKVDFNRLHCNYCNKLISGPTYKCTECNEFILHKFCAELPNKLEFLPENCPSFLTENPPTYNFPETHKCNACKQFSSNCNDCLLQTYIKIGHLPTICNYEEHIHPLSFVTMPLWFNYVYKCADCDKPGKSISYKCYNCNFDLHINCASMRKEEPALWAAEGLVSFPGSNPMLSNWKNLYNCYPSLKLGEGTFGATYKVNLAMETTVAVKWLRKVIVSVDEFREKIEAIGKLKDENLLQLRAYYCSKDEKFLVYDYMPMGSLSAFLHEIRSPRSPLSLGAWLRRLHIALGAARAIAYLHSQGQANCHGNIRSSNILLTESFEARVSDFGLAHLAEPILPPNHDYAAPKLRDASEVSHEADVYSFGMLIFELIIGYVPTRSTCHGDEKIDLPRWVRSLEENKIFDDGTWYLYVDKYLVGLVQLAMICTAQDPDDRPSMAGVKSEIEKLLYSS